MRKFQSTAVLDCLPKTFGVSGSNLYSRLVCPSSVQMVLPFLHRSRSIWLSSFAWGHHNVDSRNPSHFPPSYSLVIRKIILAEIIGPGLTPLPSSTQVRSPVYRRRNTLDHYKRWPNTSACAQVEEPIHVESIFSLVSPLQGRSFNAWNFFHTFAGYQAFTLHPTPSHPVGINRNSRTGFCWPRMVTAHFHPKNASSNSR
jgi:hypothetical protein